MGLVKKAAVVTAGLISVDASAIDVMFEVIDDRILLAQKVTVHTRKG